MPDRGRLWFLGLATAALAASAFAEARGGDHIAKAGQALAHGDGIAAEAELKRAIEAGARREEVAAAMGEAWMDQGDTRRAREWLGNGNFTPGTEVYGYRMLGRLERMEGNLKAAGAAYDHALSIKREDAPLWVDIAHLRYAGGEQIEAIGAVDKALAIDPGNAAALLLRGQMVRDAFGPASALPWFEAALAQTPDDPDALAEYAGTLGEAGRASEMLVVVRRLDEVQLNNARGFFLQSVLAARAGNYGLARTVLNRIKGPVRDQAATQLLQGGLELEAGNTAQAIDILDRLAHRQPANLRVRHLLARAFYDAGDYKTVVKRFGPFAARRDASAYLLTLVARAHEELGERDLAAPLLDRAAAEPVGQLVIADEAFDAVVPGGGRPGPQMRAALGNGQTGAAVALGDRLRDADSGSGDAQGLLGDALAAAGRPLDAIAHYREAAKVRLDEDLLLRMLVAQAQARQSAQSDMLLAQFQAGNPESMLVARLLANRAAGRGDWSASRALLESMIARGHGRDVRLLCDLAFAQLRQGDNAAAVTSASAAYSLQPANPIATQALAITLAAQGERPKAARSLLEKAKRIGGDNPLLSEARKQLGKR